MKNFLSASCNLSNKITLVFDWLADVFLLVIRLYLTKVFLWSGILKILSWQSTIYLFENEFKVAFLSPTIAAVLATGIEIILPFLLLIGFGARIPAIALFIFNIMNVLSYPLLLQPEYFCALKDHILWGICIAIPMFFGHGRLSVDYWIQRKVCQEYKY